MSDDLPNVPQYHDASNKAKKNPETPTEKENSENEKGIEQIAQGVKRKKPIGRRIFEAFTGEDVQSVGQYVFWDVLIPAAKSAVVDAITTGIERAIYGDVRPRSSGGYRPSNYTPYNRSNKTTTTTRYDSGWKPRAERPMSREARASHNFDEIILETRNEAEDVLGKLTNLIEQYGMASVSELYSLVNVTGSFADDKWGWVSAAGFTWRRLPGAQGYLLDLPSPEAL